MSDQHPETERRFDEVLDPDDDPKPRKTEDEGEEADAQAPFDKHPDNQK